MKHIKAIFITGTSGAGKSTLTAALRALSLRNVIVLDMDQLGHVPKGADQKWRIQKTGRVMDIVNENARAGKSTIVCGVTTPPEVHLYAFMENITPVFGLLEIAPDTVRTRLTARGWENQKIEDNVIWAEHLKRFVMAEADHFFINSETHTPDEIAGKVKDILEKKLDTPVRSMRQTPQGGRE